jgi:hypothetical protein
LRWRRFIRNQWVVEGLMSAVGQVSESSFRRGNFQKIQSSTPFFGGFLTFDCTKQL